MAELKAKAVGSTRNLKKSLKNVGKGGANYTTRISKDGLTVRFLTEPSQWVEYLEHYDEGAKEYFPCSDDCPGCDDGKKPAKKFLVRALDRDGNKVIGLVLASTLAAEMDLYLEKYKTIMDRDYELLRSGEGKNDTRYKAVAESPEKLRISRYDGDKPANVSDLMDMLKDSLTRAFEGRDDDDVDDDMDDEDDLAEVDDEPVTRRTRSRKKIGPAPTTKRTVSKTASKTKSVSRSAEPLRKKRTRR